MVILQMSYKTRNCIYFTFLKYRILEVNISLKKPGSKLEHQGIKVEFIGQIEMFYDRGNHHEFISLVKELARPGEMIAHSSYPFEFSCVEKPFEVYTGANVRLRYFLRVTIIRRLADIVKEVDIAVHTLSSYPEMNNSIKMEVGIEDCLHIEFEYNKSKYHLKDVIVGKIYFLLVRIKIKHMEIAIIKKETTGSGPNTFTENVTIAKYEIMDGAPVRGESIPIRVFLAGYELTPTMRDINKKFSVRYFLNLVLMDTEDRRYFKQQEITLWRKGDKLRKPNVQSPAIMAGTQNLQNTQAQTAHLQAQQAAQQKQQQSEGDNSEKEPMQKQAMVKEDFQRAPSNSQDATAPREDAFDGRLESPGDDSPESEPIQNMTREQGDGQNNENSADNAE
ncbi:unnamed protein product [Acanthoscelides obtectus]|uniref:Uncharacterized protein n=1 Tax=Acanthoscelides obtectus TaxID=200917 RepID=A0A9P0M4N4_ACAOB|nr:unnamed protein product [Acanthoscelides obtectus]CAK1665121.1 Vacuolar protein sorting-associated protein 26 [Acanthoscelides obtectus]